VALLDVQVFGDSNTCSVAKLDPAQVVNCAVTHVVTQDDFDSGAVAVQLSGVLATPAVSAPFLSPPAVSTAVYLNQTAALAVTVAPAATFNPTAGTIVAVKISVQSVGSVTVTDVLASSSVLSFTGCSAASLAPGKALSCDATVALTPDMVDAGLVKLPVSATGKGSGKTTMVDTTTQLTIPSVSALSSRVVSVTAPKKAGESAMLTIEWKNIGDTRLKQVTAGTQCSLSATLLEPGATTSCSWQQTATQEDFDAADADNKPFAVKVVSTGLPNRGGAAQVVSTVEAQVVLPVSPALEITGGATATIDNPGEHTVQTSSNQATCSLVSMHPVHRHSFATRQSSIIPSAARVVPAQQ
jgi:hypothetical protein